MPGFFDQVDPGLLLLANAISPQNRVAQGLLAGVQFNQGMEDRKLKNALAQAQIGNYESEVEQRKAAIAKQQALQAMGESLLGARPQAQPGQLGSGTFGIFSPAQGTPDIPMSRPGLEHANINDIARLRVAGGPDLLPDYKLAREGFERKPGTFYESIGGKREYIADPTKGISYDGQTVGVMPGFANATAQIGLATEAPKALLNAAGAINLRKNQDGTESPVSALTENPTLQGILGALLSPQQAAQAARMQPRQQGGAMPSVLPQQPNVAPQPGVTGNFKGSPEEAAAEIAKITDPQERANAQAAFNEQMRRTNGQLPAYGRTIAQEIADAAAKEKAVKQAGADVQPTKQRRDDIASANYMLSVIDQTMNHPALPTATGLQGTLDPRNYLPGTDAKGAQSLINQVRGGTFLQAYNGLKGAGAITELEGAKAENAIARLNTAQSTPEFKAALSELRQVIANGLERTKRGAVEAGVAPTFPGDNTNIGGGATASWGEPAPAAGGWSIRKK